MRNCVTLIYVNWNSYQDLIRSVKSVVEFVKCDYEIVVVDNATDFDEDDFRSRFKAIENSRLLAHRNMENLGFSIAVNQAVRMATGNYYLLINCDTWFVDDAITPALETLQQKENSGVLGIRHQNPDGSFQISMHSFPTPLFSIFGLFASLNSPLVSVKEEVQQVDWICGSFMLIPRLVWEKVGAFNERFFAYDEDIDYCRRVRDQGLKVFYASGLKFFHRGSGTGPYINDKTFLNLRSRCLYLKLHEGWFWGGIYYWGVLLRLLPGVLGELLTQGEKKNERRKRWLQWLSMGLKTEKTNE